MNSARFLKLAREIAKRDKKFFDAIGDDDEDIIDKG